MASALSSTVLVRGPAWSVVHEVAQTPVRLMRPNVALNPTTPQLLAGWRTDPPVSVPIESSPIPAATAAPEPPLVVPGLVEGSHGL